jgi:hypothetical protein
VVSCYYWMDDVRIGTVVTLTDLKMCEQLDIRGKTFWIPIEPQPCCENCQKKFWCKTFQEWMELGKDTDKTFCSDWEAKK